jgi:hypothetical protein
MHIHSVRAYDFLEHATRLEHAIQRHIERLENREGHYGSSAYRLYSTDILKKQTEHAEALVRALDSASQAETFYEANTTVLWQRIQQHQDAVSGLAEQFSKWIKSNSL